MTTESAIEITSGKGFKFIKNIVVHDSREQKIVLDFYYIPDKDGSLHHIALKITKSVKRPSESWSQASTTKTTLSTEPPHQSLLKLVNALKAQKDLYQRENSKVVILDSQEANLFKQVGEGNIPFVLKILSSFQSKEAKDILLQLNESDLHNLYAAVKQIKNKQAVDTLKSLIIKRVDEKHFQKWVESNTWVFGTEYIRKIDTRRIGIHSEADFIVESLDGFTDLVELKKPDVPLFNKDESRKCYYPSAELSKVIGQAIHYIKIMEDHRGILKEDDDLDVLKPRVKVVIGRSNNLNTEEKKALRLLNASLHGIEIITYDEIIYRANKIISVYDDKEDL